MVATWDIVTCIEAISLYITYVCISEAHYRKCNLVALVIINYPDVSIYMKRKYVPTYLCTNIN